MTREEAIQLIDEIASSYYPCDKKDALEMAIKALELCEDAISREDAMSMILCYGNEIKAEVMDDIKASMIKLPPVTPQESKTGHWIYERCDMYSCSVCHHWHTDLDEKMNYCPNCGARMIEPQESEVTE